MIGDLLDRYSLLGVYFKQFGYEVSSDTWEPFWPFDLEVEDIAEEFILW